MLFRAVVVGCFCVVLVGLCADVKRPSEPRTLSIFPFSGAQSQTYKAVIRGSGLEGAQGLFFKTPGLQGRVVRVEEEPAELLPVAAAPKGKTPPPLTQLLHVEVEVGKDVPPGAHKFRVVCANGTSNELSLRVAGTAVQVESAEDRTLRKLPTAVTGKISTSGEVDDYWFEVGAGEAYTFEAVSGSATIDPTLALFEPSGSWFDAKRLNRLAFNDEGLPFPGITKNAKIGYRFNKPGKYCVRVQGAPGQGGPDAAYELRVVSGMEPAQPLRPELRVSWEERELVRPMPDNWMAKVAERGVKAEVPEQPERYRAVLVGAPEIPTMKLPGFVEGAIRKPGEQHAIQINIDKAQELVIEVETPKATTPIFSPVIRLLEAGGREVISNVYTRLNNNNLQMMKSLKAKATFSLVAPGTYTLQIRELTTDHGGDDFEYRVLVRQQIPHLGRFIVQQDQVNLKQGDARPISVRLEREEGFNGTVAVQVENLPAGVSALTGVELPPERPVLPNAGKFERYEPKVQLTSVLLSAANDAPASKAPESIRLVARPMLEGRLGDPVASAEVLLMVVGPQ
jgi:hypothetical protein